MSLTIPEEVFEIQAFDAIPAQFQVEPWARFYIGMGKCSLKNIPAHLIDDDMRLLAVNVVPHDVSGKLAIESFLTIRPADSERYEEIALAFIKHDWTNVNYIDSSIINNAFMEKALAVNGMALIPFLQDLKCVGKIELTQELIDLAISCSPAYIKFEAFLHDKYRAEAVSECIKKHLFDWNRLKKIGHFQTLVDVIKGGDWPTHFPDKPESLADGVEKMLSTSKNRIVYRAYVMANPLADVIGCMDSLEKKLELLDMYTNAELAPFLREGPLAVDRDFKGRLLELGLGL